MSISDSDDSVTESPESSDVESKSSRRFGRTIVLRRSIAGTSLQSRVILDSGTEAIVAGGRGWRPVSISKQKSDFSGALPSMDIASLPLADVVTAICSDEGETVLLGLGAAAYDSSCESTEALFNTHDLRDLGVTVHDKAKVHGGEQSLIINRIKFALN